jgi:hypothetical protein
MNIRMEYLYRDAGNYKNWGEVVLSNPTNLPLQRVEKMLIDALFEGLYFIADSAGLPDLHFTECNAALDHDWYEWHGLAETKEPVSDSDGRSIEQLIEGRQSQSIGLI